MNQATYYPRTLIISRNALRQSGSNGKVLGQLFANWPVGTLAQFYTYNEYPDNPQCTRYYRVTDKDVLHSLLSFKKKGGVVGKDVAEEGRMTHNVQYQSVKKSPLTLLLRDIMWNTNLWRTKDLWRWIEDFNPEIVVVMAGASSFTHKIAINVANKYHLPLVIYNTENYYFKNYNYLARKGWKFFYPLFKKQSDRMFRRLMQQSSHEVYNNRMLENIYYEGFGKHGSVLFQATSLDPMPMKEKNGGGLVFSYAGNLGLDRHLALMEIGAALQRISPDYVIDVYGRVTAQDVEDALRNAQGIRFHGLVPYSKVLQIMKDSDFMVHAESFSPFWVKDLCTAFSTKISDVLASGRCLILYAHESLACSQYVKENECGCVITKPEELELKLREVISSTDMKKKYIENGLTVAHRDMNSAVNSERFRKILMDAMGKLN